MCFETMSVGGKNLVKLSALEVSICMVVVSVTASRIFHKEC